MKRRWLTRIAVCLILGAITTVAVAWGIEIRNVTRPRWGVGRLAHATFDVDPRHDAFVEWFVERLYGPGCFGVSSVRLWVKSEYWYGSYSDSGALELLTDIPELATPSDDFRSARTLREQRVIHGYGWPALALVWEQFAPPSPTEDWALELSDLQTRHVVRLGSFNLPFRPVFAGFASNTLLFAAGWFAILYSFAGFRCAKRAIRRRRGRCPMCGYDLRGHSNHGREARATGCPECGWNRQEHTA